MSPFLPRADPQRQMRFGSGFAHWGPKASEHLYEHFSPSDVVTRTAFPHRWGIISSRRLWRLLMILVLPTMAFVTMFWGYQNGYPTVWLSERPPLYERFREYELRLPQHQLDGSYPEGENVKYLWVANHVWGLGWGNIMQETLLNHYLAYRSGRSFVFNNYTWKRHNSLYANYNGKYIPSRVPLSALIQGPTAGAASFSNPTAPRAVMKEFWDKVCPESSIVRLRNEDVAASLGGSPTAGQLIDRWVEVLAATESRCVEVPYDTARIFDIFIFGDPKRLLDVWPSFSGSPILSEFGWSPLVELAFDMNRETFAPTYVFEPFLSSLPVTGNSAERYTAIPGLLALHVRRGDFEEHCQNLARWHSGYSSYNAFPAITDRLEIPGSTTEEERIPLYQPHCYPDITQIVAKAEEARVSKAGKGLRYVYVMTNGPTEWVAELEDALKARGWENVASSRDLILNREQEYVKQAVDMLIGQRAQVLIGNGFSSLTGQIVMLRMANRISPDTNRFW